MERRISMRNSPSCSAKREGRTDWMRWKQGFESGIFWCVWNVRKSNAETRIVKEVVVKREWKNDDGRPKSVNARIATIKKAERVEIPSSGRSFSRRAMLRQSMNACRPDVCFFSRISLAML